jgi:hypothetical protein
VSNPADLDVFSALVSGLAHQQVANDPGGESLGPPGPAGRRHVPRRRRPASAAKHPGGGAIMTQTTITDVTAVPRIGHDEAMRIAAH